MKKILVVLLILAVAGGVFAQEGSWSLGASAQIGTHLTLDPLTPAGGGVYNEVLNADNNQVALIQGNVYHRPYHEWGAIRGNVNLGYVRGPLNIGLDFDTRGYIMATSTASGDNYRFVIAGAINSWFDASTAGALGANSAMGGEPRIKRLWGEYKMLNEMLTLVAAYVGPDTMYWVSDDTAGLIDDVVAKTAGFGLGGYHHYFPILFGHGNSGVGHGQTFTKVDMHNYLLADFGFSGLNFGVMMPNVFRNGYIGALQGHQQFGLTQGTLSFAGSDGPAIEFVEDVLKRSVLGVKFSMSPIEFAAQFRIADYGIYFGGKFFAGPVTVGMSFMGILNDPASDARLMKFGGSVDYNAGAFGAGVSAWYRNHRPGALATVFNSVIGIEPSFFFNVIPTHLRFELDAGFYFDDFYNGGTVAFSKDIYWAVQPQLFWNFRGTGAGSFWGVSTGIIGRYRIVSERVNALDVVFRFGI